MRKVCRRRRAGTEAAGSADRAFKPGASSGEKSGNGAARFADCRFFKPDTVTFSGAQLSAVGLANEIAGFRSEVSVRDIIATYPYPNTLIVCRISGKQLKQVMGGAREYFAVATDGTVQVAESFLVPKVEHYNYDYYMGQHMRLTRLHRSENRIKNLTYQRKTVTDDPCLSSLEHSTDCVRKPADNFRTFPVCVPYDADGINDGKNITARSRCLLESASALFSIADAGEFRFARFYIVCEEVPLGTPESPLIVCGLSSF